MKLKLNLNIFKKSAGEGKAKPGEPALKPKFRVEPLVAVTRGRVLTSYQVDQALVTISEDGGRGYYTISEPPLNAEERQVYSLLMENLYFSLKPLAEIKDPMKYVEGFIWEAAEELGLVDKVQRSLPKYRYYIARDAFGYGSIHVPMMDPNIEEISCTGVGRPLTVIHRHLTEFDWLDTNIVFESEDELRVFVQRLAQRVGKSVTVAVPFTDAITREGHRIAITFADEVTLPGSTFAIRKFPEEPLNMAHIIKYGTLTPLMAAYLWLIAEHKGYIIVLGAMGTGKTTLLNCILTMLPPTVKIATIEDTCEIKIPHKNWQRFKSRQTYGGMEGARYEVSLFDLVKLSLRYRPDYISVGEARGEEIVALNQAALLGHGSFTTFHAESPEAALQRMRNPPLNVPEGNLMHISCFVQLARIVTPGGKRIRRVTEITEVMPGEKLRLNRLFTWDPRRDAFEPDNPLEVVDRSVRLITVMRLTGMTTDEICLELEARANLLRRLVEEGKLFWQEFSEAVLKYHTEERKALLARLSKT